MSRPKITDEQRMEAFLNTASKEQLLRLESDVRAALRWKYGRPVKSCGTTSAAKANDQEALPLAAT